MTSKSKTQTQPNPNQMVLGPYAQIGKGIPDIIQWLQEMGANTAQVYNGNPRSLRLKTKHTWTNEEVDALREADIPLWFHAGHLVHLAAHPIESRARVLADLEDNVRIGGSGVVVHTGFGNHGGTEKLIEQLLWLDQHAPPKARIIVEVPSGQTNHLGFPYTEYAQLMARLPKRRFWVGLDTAHLFAGGVDLRKSNSLQDWLQEMAKASGQTRSAFEKRVALLHLNDAGVELGAGRDYHAPLGRGYWLGKHLGGNPKVLFEVLRWAKSKKVAVILETKGDYAREVEWIRKAEANGFKDTVKLLQQKNRKSRKGEQDGGEGTSQRENLRSILEDMRAYREMTGEPFRARAYDRLLRLLDRDETPFNREHLEYWKGRPGVGQGLGEKLEEILRRGTWEEYEEIRKKPELKAWKVFMAIPGVGPSMAQKFVREGDQTLQDIKKRTDLTQKQRFGVEHYEDLQKKVSLTEARWWHKKIESVLKGKEIGRGDVRVELMGGFRTGKKTGHDIDFVLTTPEHDKKKGGLGEVVRQIIERGREEGWVVEGDETWQKQGWSGYVKKPAVGSVVRAMDIRWAPYREFPFWTLYFGSGVVWNQYLRQRAKEMGFQLNQKGLFYRGTNRRVQGVQSEEDVFQILNVPWVPPHKRASILPGNSV